VASAPLVIDIFGGFKVFCKITTFKLQLTFFVFTILTIGCASVSDERETNPVDTFNKKFANDFSATETDLYNEFAGENIVIWKKGTRFANLNIDNFQKLQSVKIVLTEAYPGSWSIGGTIRQNYSKFNVVLTFLDNNNNFEDVSLECSYSGNSDKYKNNFSKDLIEWSKKYYFKTLDGSIKNIIDVADNIYLLIYNENLKIIYDSEVIDYQNALKWQELLAAYGTSNYIHFKNLVGQNNYNTDNIWKEWEERGNIHQGTLMLLRPGETDIFGTKQNTYICETTYYLVRYNSPIIDAIAQFVIIDNMGVIKNEKKSIIRNANGPDIEITLCSLSNQILLKCIGQTNITLQNGRVVPRLMFQTIEFRNDDPNKPK
jgi:hypothetical protein